MTTEAPIINSRGVAAYVHRLKCSADNFDAIASGAKRAECRLEEDRKFKAGDVLDLTRTDERGKATEPLTRIVVEVTHVDRAAGVLELRGSHSDDGGGIATERQLAEERGRIAAARSLLERWDSRYPREYQGDDTLTPDTAAWLEGERAPSTPDRRALARLSLREAHAHAGGGEVKRAAPFFFIGVVFAARIAHEIPARWAHVLAAIFMAPLLLQVGRGWIRSLGLWPAKAAAAEHGKDFPETPTWKDCSTFAAACSCYVQCQQHEGHAGPHEGVVFEWGEGAGKPRIEK